MARFPNDQVSFNAGEISTHASARTDLPQYSSGVETMENFLPSTEGAAEKRPGTEFVADTSRGKRAVLLPFEFSSEQSYVMEFTDQRLRVYNKSRRLVAWTDGFSSPLAIGDVSDTNPVHIEAVGGLPASGIPATADGMTIYITGCAQEELNNRYFTIDNFALPGIVEFDLVGEDGTGRFSGASGGTADQIMELRTPYLEADLDKIQIRQRADEVYIVCSGYRAARIVRFYTVGEAENWVYQPDRVAFPVGIGLAGGERHVPSGAVSSTNPVVVTRAAHGMFNGDIVYMWETEMLEINDRYFEVANRTAGNFELLGENGTTRVQVTNEDAFPGRMWKTEALPVSPAIDRAPPFNPLNASAVTMYFDSGTSEIVASDFIFEPKHNGLCLRVYLDENEWGFGYINVYQTALFANTVSVMVVNAFPAGVTGSLNATSQWSFEALGHNALHFYEDRLWFAGTEEAPQTMWGSVTSNYTNFITYNSVTGTVLATSAVSYTILASQLNEIVWFDGNSPMFAGTKIGEYTVQGIDPTVSISPFNIADPKRVSNFGSGRAIPSFSDEVLFFIQRKGQKIRSFRFENDSKSFVAENVNRLARHIASGTRIRQIVFQNEPNRMLWVVTEDGQLASFVYEKAEQVSGWSRALLGGDGVHVDSVAVISNIEDDSQELWVSVARTINGTTQRCNEIMTGLWETVQDNTKPFFLDAAVRYDGAPETVFFGLNHLNGESVTIVSDGKVLANQTVPYGGMLTLEAPGSVVTFGLSYSSKIKQLDTAIQHSSDRLTLKGFRRRIVSVVIGLHETGPGLWVGDRFSTDESGEVMEEIDLEAMDEMDDEATDLFNGDTDMYPVPGRYARTSKLAIEHRLALPCTILSAFTVMTTEEQEGE